MHENDQNLVDVKGANLDPITGAPGAHPVGTGVGGTLGGVAASALAGSVVGPVGTIVGMAVGVVLGGLAGKTVAESIDPTTEEAYWRKEFPNRPYADAASTYEDFDPTFRFGWEANQRYAGKSWEDAQSHVKADWERDRPGFPWEKAQAPIRDSWDRVDTQRREMLARGESPIE